MTQPLKEKEISRVRGAAHPAASAAIYCYTPGEKRFGSEAPGARSPICPAAASVSG